MDVILLDGEQRSTLAATRSLGKKGISVRVGADRYRSIAKASKYCSGSFIYNSPYNDDVGFISSIERSMNDHQDTILFPMTDITTSLVLQHIQPRSEKFKIPFVNYEKYTDASDKVTLFRIAEKMVIPRPRTIFSEDYEYKNLLIEVQKNGFPVVVKPARSIIKTERSWRKTKVRHANSQQEFIKTINEEDFIHFPFLIQERIEGNGIGIFCLVENGDILCHFAHRRIREKPPSGGVSVLCESIEAPHEALESARKLLSALNWYGVAMVEFKWDKKDDRPKLMEINGRFWGSLQLAISSGVDFPYLLYCMASGEKLELPNNYRIGIRSRWELGDLDHLLIRLTNKNRMLNLSTNTIPRTELIREFIFDFFRPSVRNEIFRLDDIGPFMCEFKEYLRNVLHLNRFLAVSSG